MKLENSNTIIKANSMKLLGAASLIALSTVFTFIPAAAAEEDIYFFKIESQPLVNALLAYSKLTNVVVSVRSELLAGKMSPPMNTEMSAKEALPYLLQDTELDVVERDDGSITIRALKGDGFQKISYSTNADYEASLGAYEGDERADDVDAFELDEIIVTAGRRVQNLQDVPSSISVVNPDDLKKSGLLSLNDLIAYTPGFDFKSEGQRGTGAITARGITQLGTTSVVAVYVDDVPMTGSTPFSSGEDLFFDGLFGNLERVEFLRGPQGTLWGATSIGGAVRYITKKPELSETHGNVSATLSSIKGGGLNQLYSGYISTPIVEDKLGISLSGFYGRDGGFSDLVDFTNGNVIEEDVDGSESYGFSADILFAPTDDLEIRVKAFYQDQIHEGSNNVAFSDEEFEEGVSSFASPTFGNYTNDNALFNFDTEYTLVSASIDYAFESTKLSAVASYNKSSPYALGDARRDFAPIFEGPGEGQLPPGTITSIPFVTDGTIEKHTQELRLTSETGGKLEWIIGLFHVEEKNQENSSIVINPLDIDLLRSTSSADYSEYAAFGNLTYYITPDFDLTAGIRYSRSKLTVNAAFSGLLAGPPAEEAPISKENVATYLFTARYRANDNLSLYARVASGYRPAATNIPTRDFQGNLIGSPLVDADNVWSYEIGAKGSNSSNTLSYDLSAYYITWDNLQAEFQFGAISVLANAAGGATSKGFEGSLTYSPLKNMTLASTLAYVDSSLRENEFGLNALAGAKLPGQPKWSATTALNYLFDVSSDVSGTVGLSARYRGNAPGEFAGGGFDDTIVSITTPSYVLADFNLGFEFERYTLSFFVTNLFDNLAYDNIEGTVEEDDGEVIYQGNGIPVRPRTIGVNLLFDF